MAIKTFTSGRVRKVDYDSATQHLDLTLDSFELVTTSALPILGIRDLTFNGLNLIAAVVLALLESLDLRLNISAGLLLDSELVLALRNCLICQFIHLAMILDYLSLSSCNLLDDIALETPESLLSLHNSVPLDSLLIDLILKLAYLLL